MRWKQLTLSVQDLRRPIPYARAVFLFSLLLFFEVFLFSFISLVFHSAGWIVDWGWVLAFAFSGAAFSVVAWWHSVVMRWWPHTVKFCVADAPEFPVKGAEWHPGSHVRAVELPTQASKPPPGARVELDEIRKQYFWKFRVELALGGNAVENLPWPRKRPFCFIGYAQFESEGEGGVQAGILEGKRYNVPLRPEMYVAGDLPNWRGFDWYALARDEFGNRVTRRTTIILCLDPLEPKTWKPTPADREVRRELFLSQQSLANVSKDYAGFLGRKDDRERMKDNIDRSRAP